MAAGAVTCDTLNPVSYSCAKFDTANSFITTPLSLTNYLKNKFTICCWAKTQSLATNQKVLAQGTDFSFRINATTGTVNFSAGGLSDTIIASTVAMSINTWYFLALVYDEATGLKSCWVNSTEKNETGITGSLATNGTYFIIGKATSGDQTVGFIKNVRIYNRALTDSEMLRLANNQDVRDSSLVANWKLEKDEVDEVSDVSATNSAVTFVNDNETIKDEFKTARVTANDKYLATEVNGKILTAHIEEA